MQGKHIAIGAVVVLIAVAGVAGALVTGFGPAPGGSDGGALGGGDSTATATPYQNTVIVKSTETEAGGGGGDGGGDADGTSTATTPDPFAFVIEEISECGDTCRIVNASVVNQQDSAATGVTVRSEIYTGGDKIWQGTSDVGTIEAGERYADSKRVELSYREGYKIQQNDGEILIKTYVETDSATYVFKDRRNVS